MGFPAQWVLLDTISQAQKSSNKIQKLIQFTLEELEVPVGRKYDSICRADSPDTLVEIEEEGHIWDSVRLAQHRLSSPAMTQPSVDGHTDAKPSQEIKEPDLDAQTLVINSLRSQIQDLFSQVSQLNNKLVQSYDRVSDLEDQLHESSNTIRSSSIKISQLELERTQHLSALNSGLLVERSHVTSELTRLMEKATEEAARRGQAESARAEIEKELDDLSAGLFGQANSMVAEARLARARSERKVEETERALKGAEEAIAAMQHQMQAFEGEKEETTRQLQDIRVTMGKGKWVDRPIHQDIESSKRLISSHAQYRDFLYFVSYLREQHQKSSQIPAMTVLLSHSFLSRLQTEDSDPTIRLDLAPSLNWLTRKSVLSAIHLGQLDIEPISSEALLQELSAAQSMIPGLNNGSHISCALCGTFIFSDPSSYSNSKPPSHPPRQTNGYSYSNWSSTILKNPLVNSIAGSVMNTPSQSPTQSRQPPSHVYIFRLAADATRMIQASSQNRAATMYPLCGSGWCLTRLRAACTLWAFIRTSVVDKVWEEPLVPRRPLVEKQKQIEPPPREPSVDESGQKPSLPPRRSRIGMFWERAASLGKGDMEKVQKTAEKALKSEESDASRSLPSTPPVHPVLLSSPKTRNVPPPLGAPIRRSVPPLPTASKATSVPPPPLPARNRDRGPIQVTESPRTSGDDQPAPIQNGIDSSHPEESPEVIRLSSDDSFTSATDAPRSLSPVLPMSPRSPSAVPLPDSRPETPITHPESKPNHPVSPKDQEVPTTTSSPLPPPLPRRAAARTRPMSIVVHSLAPPLTKVEATEQESVKASVAGNAIEATPVVTESSIPVNGDDEKYVEEKVQAEDPPGDNAVSGISEDGATKSENVGNDLSNDEDTNQVIVNGIAINTITDQDLVGDNTWEERTWKDLVKLREDMFWARIGGLR